MNKNKNVIIFLASIPLVAVIIIFMVTRINFALSFSPIEQKVFNFTYELMPSIADKNQMSVGFLKSPIELGKGLEQGFPKTSLAEIVPPPETMGKRVSFILVNQKRKLAVVDGKLVHEGDIVDNHTIARIEKNRILLKSKEGEKWLNID